MRGAVLKLRTVVRETARQPTNRLRSISCGLFLLSLASGACGKGGEESVTPPVTVASVTVAPSTIRLIVGTRDTLVATVLGSDGQIASTAVSWASSNPTIASVSGFGSGANIHAVAPGVASVRATSRGRTGEVTVTVTPARQQLTVLYGGDGQGILSSSPVGLVCVTASCSGLFDYGSSVSLSATPAVANVLTSWSAPCTGGRSCTVVMDAPRTVTANFGVFPRPVESVIVHPTLLVLDEGGKGMLSATVRDPEGNLLTDRLVTWTSDNPQVATVSRSGEVTGIAEGDTTFVIATSEGHRSSAKVVVQSTFFRAFHLGVGVEHTCAYRVPGGLHCWGSPGSDRLGNPANQGGGARMPVISGTSALVLPFPGATHTCAMSSTSTAFCWGSGERGELGDGQQRASAVPVGAAGGLRFYGMASGHAATCGRAQPDETLYCWGKNDSGTIGVGSTAATVNVPTMVSGALKATRVEMGRDHICAIQAQKTLYCWGRNDSGQLGTGDTQLRTTPSTILLSGTVHDVAAGHEHTCALDSQYALWCWGRNDKGQLGDGSRVTRAVPARVQSPYAFGQVSAGEAHTCAITTSNETYCWGENAEGQLGNGSNTASAVPVKLSGPPLRWIMTGANHSCGLMMTFDLVCWGSNKVGQLGQTSMAWSNVPVPVPRP